MSHQGKMLRGKKWASYKTGDGMLPKDIADDPNKMCDVNYFLDNSKPVVEEEVKKKKEK